MSLCICSQTKTKKINVFVSLQNANESIKDKETQRDSKHSQHMFVMTLCGEVYSAVLQLFLSRAAYPPKFATCGILAVGRRASGRTTVFFLRPQVYARQVHFGARVPAVQWGANKRQCAQVTVDSHSEAGVSEIPESSPSAAATVESPGAAWVSSRALASLSSTCYYIIAAEGD